MATNLYFRRFRRAVRNTISFVHGLGIGTATLFKGREGMRAYATSMQERLEATQKEILKSEESVMFVTIGLALTTWARMEEALVRIVQILLSAPGPKVGLIMYSIINFNAWLTIIDELYARTPPCRVQAPLEQGCSAHTKIKDMRDRLAHESAHKEVGTFSSVHLRPSKLDVRTKTGKFKPLTDTEIGDFTVTTTAITEDLITLAQDMLASLEALREKFPEQDSDHYPAEDVQ